MPKATLVTLADHAREFVERQVAEGRYQSESDVVQAGLTLLEERQAKLELLRQALVQGEESGVVEDFDIEEFLDEMKSSRVPSR